MAASFWIFTLVTLVGFHASSSYILLTANIEDIHELAKQVVDSPVVNQLNNIFRRAATMFKQQLEKGKNRNYQQEYRPRAEEDNGRDEDSDDYVERRNQGDEALAALGRNASYYLNSIKKIIFDNN